MYGFGTIKIFTAVGLRKTSKLWEKGDEKWQ